MLCSLRFSCQLYDACLWYFWAMSTFVLLVATDPTSSHWKYTGNIWILLFSHQRDTFWWENKTMKVNVMVIVWLREQSSIEAKTRHQLILHLNRAKETDRNFLLRNNFNVKETAMSKDTFKNFFFRKIVSENYPLARTQTTLNCIIMLPVSVIKNRTRVRYCGEDSSVWAHFPSVIMMIILPFCSRFGYEFSQNLQEIKKKRIEKLVELL